MAEKKIHIIDELCNRCGACVKACSFEAITLTHSGVKIDQEKCTLCKMCLRACKQDAIKVEERRKNSETNCGYSGVWVFVEYPGRMNSACLQIVSKGSELSKALGEKLTAVVVGKSVSADTDLPNALIECGAEEIRLLNCDAVSDYFPEDVASILCAEITKGKPGIVLFLASHFGRILAPRVAARIKTGLTADCTDMYINEEKKLVQVRPTYGGKILASIVCQAFFPQMASVRPNVFEAVKVAQPAIDVPIIAKNVAIDSISAVKKIIQEVAISRHGTPIEEAEIIVCGGLGLGKKEGFALLEKLAGKLGGVVAASRAVVDLGWIDFSTQIGQTGKTVRPKLYIGCGVSGAIHHLIGMKNSGVIIAINKDPRAPIFKVATVGIVGDLYEVLPKLIDSMEYKNSKGGYRETGFVCSSFSG